MCFEEFVPVYVVFTQVAQKSVIASLKLFAKTAGEQMWM